jgi:hypothetical protein
MTRSTLTKTTNLETVYAHELRQLAELLGAEATIKNTGGGCAVVEVAVTNEQGSEPATMEIITADGGLASTREDIVHWYVVIRDESGHVRAEGHNVFELETAVSRALDNRFTFAGPGEHVCPCLLVPGHDYLPFTEEDLTQTRSNYCTNLIADLDPFDAASVSTANISEEFTLDRRGVMIHRSGIGTIQFVRLEPTQIMVYDADANQRIALWESTEITYLMVNTALSDVALSRSAEQPW